MVKNNSKKRGFTLIEILIALVILALFFVAAAKILTVKPRRQYVTSVHGLYECYYDSTLGRLAYHKVEEEYNQKAVASDNPSYCTFEPSKNVAFYNIIIVTPGGGDVYTDVQPAINRKLRLYPNDTKIESDDGSGESITYSADNIDSYMSKEDLKAYLNTTGSKSNIRNALENGTYNSGAIMLKW